jgi:uncharacterized sulfatase
MPQNGRDGRVVLLAIRRCLRPQGQTNSALFLSMPDIGDGGRDGGDQFGIALPEAMYIKRAFNWRWGGSRPRLGKVPASLAHVHRQPTGNFSFCTHLARRRTPSRSGCLDKHVLMPRDNFLRSFGNISPIRGPAATMIHNWTAKGLCKSK